MQPLSDPPSENWEDSEVHLSITTPWYKVGQLQNFGRIWEAIFVGKYLSDWQNYTDLISAGDIHVSIAYDYEDTFEPARIFTANRKLQGTNRLQFSVTPKRQKCQAIRFRIEGSPTLPIAPLEQNYTNGRGFELSGIDLVYGVKAGTARKNLPKERRG